MFIDTVVYRISPNTHEKSKLNTQQVHCKYYSWSNAVKDLTKIYWLLVQFLNMENVEYSEWVPAGVLVKVSFAIVSVIIVFVTFSVFLFSEELLAEDILGVAFSWAVLGVLLFIFWNFRGIRIQITDKKLYLGYGMFNKKSFFLKEIISWKKTKAFGRYLGVGVRYGLDGSMAYTTSFANAVEVSPKVGRTFVFSSKNPDKVCEIINKHRG